jgi:hypothetical protein
LEVVVNKDDVKQSPRADDMHEIPGDERYEAPGIESVLTPEALEREVLYGGNGTIDVC